MEGCARGKGWGATQGQLEFSLGVVGTGGEGAPGEGAAARGEDDHLPSTGADIRDASLGGSGSCPWLSPMVPPSDW